MEVTIALFCGKLATNILNEHEETKLKYIRKYQFENNEKSKILKFICS